MKRRRQGILKGETWSDKKKSARFKKGKRRKMKGREKWGEDKVEDVNGWE